jgi:type IV secretory pathway VirJ component
MKKILVFLAFLLLITFNIKAIPADSTYFSPFGKIHIYHKSTKPDGVVLFVSGDGGWNLGVVEMAKSFAGMNYLVVGIDILHYLKHLNNTGSACLYPAADFELLSKFVQKKYKVAKYYNPVLIGYSSGATLVYGILAQAPENTFKGAIGLGFCPDIDVNKLFCKGSGLESSFRSDKQGIDLTPSKNLTAPYIALLGMMDKVCDEDVVKSFMARTNKGQIVLLPKVGHGFAVQKNWMPQLKDAFAKISQHYENKSQNTKPNPVTEKAMVRPKELDELPLHITPSVLEASKPMAFIFSGDGGWTGFDQELATNLAKKNVPCIGLDDLHYFWDEKKPDQVVKDLLPIIDYYLKIWHKSNFILMGYSFGADITPFIYNHLPVEMKEKTRSLALLSPSESADFEIHVADMLNMENPSDNYDVINELKKLKNINTLCIFGKEEETIIPQQVKAKNFHYLITSGGHHFDNNFSEIVEEILKKSEP